MKRIAFVISHEGSGSSGLCRIMDNNPRIQWCKLQGIYNHVDSLENLISIPHKLNNIAAVWVDELIHNWQFVSKSLYQCCRFIYVVRDASTLGAIVKSKEEFTYKERYYRYRLRRMCEMARQTPGAVLLTYDDIATGRGLPLLADYLDLKEPLKFDSELFKDHKKIESKLTQEVYERYLFYLRNVGLRYFSF